MAHVMRYKLSMFAPRVGDTFQIQSEEGMVTTVELVEAVGRKGESACDAPPPDTGNFIIVFRDPQTMVACYLPQGTYRIEHGELGSRDLFIVPIRPETDGQGIRYEVVFAAADSA